MFGSSNSGKGKTSKGSCNASEENKDCNVGSNGALQEQQSQNYVQRKLGTLTFGHCRKILKDSNKKGKCLWTFKFPSRTQLVSNTEAGEGTSSTSCNGCMCMIDKENESGILNKEETTVDRSSQSSPVNDSLPSSSLFDIVKLHPEDFRVEDWEECARQQRAREIEEGVEPSPGFTPCEIEAQVPEITLSETLALCLQNHLLLVVPPTPYFKRISNEAARLSRDVLDKLRELHFQVTKESFLVPPSVVHTQVDYIHCLVPDLLEITKSSSYWGKMDRYEAEKLLENKAEGTFLLRDSAQEEYLFSVSFQRYGRSLHARIEQWNHKFSFDSHDPGVFASNTVCGLIEHYKDPSCCMYFEPMLTIPLHRTVPFSLQHLCRAAIGSKISYIGINSLQLPRTLKICLKEYHYRQRVRVRRFDVDA